jgi:hypothetical protein
MYYLYIKQHEVTKLRYLGYTTSKNPYKYKGSGKYWLKHLTKHGNKVITTILLATDNFQDIIDTGLYFSTIFNVVQSKDWANLKLEAGDGGWDYVNSNITPNRSDYHKEQGVKLGHNNKGKATVRDSTGNIFKVSINDIRVITGELVGHTKGVSNLYDSSGVLHKIPTGSSLPKELHGNNYGKHFITDGLKNKMILKSEAIPEGWVIGTTNNKNKHNKGKIWITNGTIEKMVLKDTIIPEGWKRGRS